MEDGGSAKHEIELGNGYKGANMLMASQYLPTSRANVSVTLEEITVSLGDLRYDDNYEFLCEAVGVSRIHVERKRSKPLPIQNVKGKVDK